MKQETKKGVRGTWKPGQSGNPAGRPSGAGKVAALREAIGEHVPAVIAKLLEKAKEGDAAAARLLLERVIPPLKASEETSTVPLQGDTISEQGRAVLVAVSDGAIAPGQGAVLLAALGNLAKLVETDELSRRISALEGNAINQGARL